MRGISNTFHGPLQSNKKKMEDGQKGEHNLHKQHKVEISEGIRIERQGRAEKKYQEMEHCTSAGS